MADDKSSRRPRADGLRNRARLLEIAGAAFLAGETDLPFDELARRAEVGIGTLYRHFPSRDALVEALYRARVEELGAAAERLAAEHTPLDALREWMQLFVDYLAAKRLIAPALEALVGRDAGVFAASGDIVKGAVRSLAARAVEAGDLDPEVDPIDLLRALTGILNIASGPEAGERARRFVDILLAGARPGAGAPDYQGTVRPR